MSVAASAESRARRATPTVAALDGNRSSSLTIPLTADLLTRSARAPTTGLSRLGARRRRISTAHRYPSNRDAAAIDLINDLPSAADLVASLAVQSEAAPAGVGSRCYQP
jgi:hypothetical protein